MEAPEKENVYDPIRSKIEIIHDALVRGVPLEKQRGYLADLRKMQDMVAETLASLRERLDSGLAEALTLQLDIEGHQNPRPEDVGLLNKKMEWNARVEAEIERLIDNQSLILSNILQYEDDLSNSQILADNDDEQFAKELQRELDAANEAEARKLNQELNPKLGPDTKPAALSRLYDLERRLAKAKNPKLGLYPLDSGPVTEPVKKVEEAHWSGNLLQDEDDGSKSCILPKKSLPPWRPKILPDRTRSPEPQTETITQPSQDALRKEVKTAMKKSLANCYHRIGQQLTKVFDIRLNYVEVAACRSTCGTGTLRFQNLFELFETTPDANRLEIATALYGMTFEAEFVILYPDFNFQLWLDRAICSLPFKRLEQAIHSIPFKTDASKEQKNCFALLWSTVTTFGAGEILLENTQNASEVNFLWAHRRWQTNLLENRPPASFVGPAEVRARLRHWASPLPPKTVDPRFEACNLIELFWRGQHWSEVPILSWLSALHQKCCEQQLEFIELIKSWLDSEPKPQLQPAEIAFLFATCNTSPEAGILTCHFGLDQDAVHYMNCWLTLFKQEL